MTAPRPGPDDRLIAETTPRRELTLGRKLAFALVATVLLLGVAEVILRVAGLGPSPDRTTTWFSDHILLPPLWHERTETEPAVTYMAVGQAEHFHPFARDKADDTFRVAVFGGSAAHGYGVLEPGAFPHRLEQLLQEVVPDREIQVVNLGTIAWSSQQIIWAARQVFELGEWDLVLVYSGHNELLELSSWKTYMQPGEHRRYTRVLLLNQRLQNMRLYRVVRLLLGKEEPPALGSADPPPEPVSSGDPDEQQGGQEELADLRPGVDPIAITPAMRLDGMNPVPREERARIGPLEREYAARTYTHNIGHLVELARSAGTPVIVMNPAPNDDHDPAWFPYAGEEGERFDACLEAAETERGREGAPEAAQLCLTMQPEDPRAHFVMAQNLSSVGRGEESVAHLVEARRTAEYPNRVVPEVSDAIRAFEGRDGVLAVVDVEEMFRARREDRLISYDLVYDHCHPSAPANWLIAGEVARLVFEAKLLPPPADMAALQARAEAGFADIQQRTAADPRLWEWTGLTFHPDRVEYIADFQGDWTNLREAQEAAVSTDEATAMAWLWAGNGRFYGYDITGAVDAWQRAARLDMTLCLAHANAARGLRLVGARQEALAEAVRATDCDPPNEEYRAERALLEKLKR